eukprot:TRINITY_DN2817_c0_g4_i1.p1 TRINITY_DN2817_c0_g4~~TRINITY_DN2817_c0_g4_i1.p1  ORF type:complete len:268 (+),score=30.52 TRINITY_DN2817_c0_g4_i1:33-806(+)
MDYRDLSDGFSVVRGAIGPGEMLLQDTPSMNKFNDLMNQIRNGKITKKAAQTELTRVHEEETEALASYQSVSLKSINKLIKSKNKKVRKEDHKILEERRRHRAVLKQTELRPRRNSNSPSRMSYATAPVGRSDTIRTNLTNTVRRQVSHSPSASTAPARVNYRRQISHSPSHNSTPSRSMFRQISHSPSASSRRSGRRQSTSPSSSVRRAPPERQRSISPPARDHFSRSPRRRSLSPVKVTGSRKNLFERFPEVMDL